MEGPAVNRVSTRLGRGSRLLLSAGALALVAICAVAGRADAQQGACPSDTNTCVMMIQVDGLEAADLSQTRTPFLWELAHPSGNPPLGERNGWTWQAPRASMSAGLGANVAASLVGGYAEQTGVPSDEFRLNGSHVQADGGGNGERVRLGGSQVDPDRIGVATSGELAGSSLFQLIQQHGDDEYSAAAIIGDPNLGPLAVGEDLTDADAKIAWYPKGTNAENPPDPGNPQNPALCDIPRSPTAGDPAALSAPACAASDEMTLSQAFQRLNTADNAGVVFTYIELAELGRIKRSGASAADVANTLQATDSALAAFFSGYASQVCATCQAKWGSTVVMLTGISGYEPALPGQRVPDPGNPNQDLAHFVENFDAPATPGDDDFELLPQGTMATVYSESALTTGLLGNLTQQHRDALAQLKAGIEGVNPADCEDTPGSCIVEVLYMRPDLVPDGSAAETVKGVHPDWHLDHLHFKDQPTGEATGIPTGRSGELLVLTAPGWATGKAVPADAIEATSADEIMTNPYPASTGGPRNRAVAALINGPQTGGISSVRDLSARNVDAGEGDRYPVASEDDAAMEGNEENPVCENSADPAFPGDGVAAANETPEDDANDPGHWCQPELVDFGITVAALLKLPTMADDICGRPLNEAFNQPIIPAVDAAGFPDADITQGPVLPPPGLQYPQTDRDVTFEFDTLVKNRAIIECGVSENVPTTFECSFDGAPYSACSSPVRLTGLPKGIHEFCVRAVSDDFRSEPECAKFEVILFFDFDGVLRDLRASVTDHEGKTWALAPRGRRMDRIVISADYGRPLNGVTLTLYKQSSGKVLCGQTVFRPKTTAATAGAQVAGGARGAASCPLTGLARFKPFKLDRGHIDLRLRIPKAYKPTHVGVTVQEVRANVLDAVTASQCQQTGSFFCFYAKVGAPEGGIVQVVDARRLHKVKGQKCGKKRKGKKRKGKKRVRKAGKKKRKRTAKRCKKNKKKKKKKKK